MSQPPSASDRAILIHFGELGLKGRNQPMFRRQLRRNLKLKLRSLGLRWPVQDAIGLMVVHVPMDQAEQSLEPVLQAFQQVFGVVWVAAAHQLSPCRFTPESQPKELADLEARLVGLAALQFQAGQSFCVRVNRGNKLLPFASPDLAARLGQAIRDKTSWNKVDLTQPDVTFNLDLRTAATFLFGQKLRGPGGLPVGTSGRALALLSGGIDSPVAAYLLAKRGCRIDFIHFTASAMQLEEALKSKIWRLARELTQYTMESRLFLVPYTHFDLALLREKVLYDLVLFRRFMVRVAERLAVQLRAKALITGDTLSQVASQTMSNLVSTSSAVQMPILRPLIGFDKQETVALAQKIGTYPISVQPYKDCCALIGGEPKTRSLHSKLTQLEERILPDYEQLIQCTLADAICLDSSSPPDNSSDVS